MLRHIVTTGLISVNLLGYCYAQSSSSESSTDAFQRIYGIKRSQESNVPESTLLTLRRLQEQRSSVPADVDAYKAYLQQNPLLNFLKTNPEPALFHLLLWNQFALDMTSIDHTSLGAKPAEPTYAEQFGPHRASRALGIVHLAMFEAVNAIYGKYESYGGIKGKIFAKPGLPNNVNPSTVSVRTAIAYAAYGTLGALYRQKMPILFANLVAAESLIGDSDDLRSRGKIIGMAAADAVLANRGYDTMKKTFSDGSNDGMQYVAAGTPYEKSCMANPNSLCLEPNIYQNTSDPTHPFKVSDPMDWEHWQMDPITHPNIALGGDWPGVKTFAIPSPYDYPAQHAPPAYTDQKFKDAYLLGGYDGKRSGGKYFNRYGVRKAGQNVSSIRDADLTFRARFWGYDGTALLCAPPRLYNMIATSIAETPGPTQIKKVEDLARYLALVNLSLADAGVAAWTGKYKFNYPRPVTFIQHHDPNTVIDGVKNSDWLPLGFAGTNSTTVSGTPPFPANPSGHAVFGGALFEMLSKYYGISKTSSKGKFTFVSDEFNGVNRGEDGKVRPRMPVTYNNFADAEWENAESRIWMGIHWQFDGDDGIAVGNQVANTVYNSILKPVH